MTTLTEFLLARIDEREERARPKTVILSGGDPVPVVPNCIGVRGEGCPDRWALPPIKSSGRMADIDDATRALIRMHELAHAYDEQRLVLAECNAIRRIVEELIRPYIAERRKLMNGQPSWDDENPDLLRLLALPYSNHPDFQEEWGKEEWVL